MKKTKNSWTISLKNTKLKQYFHYYFCDCGKEFYLKTNLNKSIAPDVICPTCGNDYFKDTNIFENMISTRIWKDFIYKTLKSEDKEFWNISFQYDVPIYNKNTNIIKFISKELLLIRLKKDGSIPFEILYKSKIVFKYSLFLDDKVQALKTLLYDEAKQALYDYILANKNKAILWIDDKKIKEFCLDDKLKYLTFFLKNSHLKEHNFFFWKMDILNNHTLKYNTQTKMLNFIANHHKEKNLKKTIYQAYENSINTKGYYYPYSDYIFSRTITNIDLLKKLYELNPTVKKYLFTDETFLRAIEFITFLKQHYTEKQIVKLFINDINTYHWRDTMLMLQTKDATNYLNKHFIKVKLTSKKLHDEIVRVFQIVSFELETKENFDYDNVYLSACTLYENLEFKLPSTVQELSVWAKKLHNCMFGYAKRIHQEKSIIYGVFKEKELFYAIEIKGFKITQAKAFSNTNIAYEDMQLIQKWQNNNLILNGHRAV